MLTASARLKLVDVPFVPYADPGSDHLAMNVEEAVRKSPLQIKVLLMENNGIIAYDSGLCYTFDITELVEETARVAFVASNYMPFQG